MSKRLLAILSITTSCVIAAVTADEAIATPFRYIPSNAFTCHQDKERGCWNGHRGYRNKRVGYWQGPDGFWYPADAFRQGRYSYKPRALRGACNLGFRPTNGPHNCNY